MTISKKQEIKKLKEFTVEHGNARKLYLIKEVQKLILADYGKRSTEEIEMRCIVCLARSAWKFLRNYKEQLEEEIKEK